MRLCHYGCATYYFIVVTGIESGNIWIDDRANDCGLYPALSKVTNERMLFSEWYNEWLHQALRV